MDSNGDSGDTEVSADDGKGDIESSADVDSNDDSRVVDFPGDIHGLNDGVVVEVTSEVVVGLSDGGIVFVIGLKSSSSSLADKKFEFKFDKDLFM